MKKLLSHKVFLPLGGVAIALALVSTLAISFSLVGRASAKPASALGAWTQQWSDEFNGSGAVSGSDWIYDLGHGYGCSTCGNWGTGEIENMTNSTANVNQTGGHLAITPLRDGAGNWTSGRIETQRTDFQPPAGGGMAVEASIQQPNVSGAAAQGYWPAFWMLGAPFRGVYTNWPSIGEIDILEDINGQSNVFGTLHCGVSPGGPCNETTGIGSGAHGCPGCQTGYHTYRIEYDKSVSPEQIRWYLDGSNYFTVNANQVDATTWANATNHGFFIILNVAIGGGWPGNPTGSTASGVPMNVDYVRVFYANGSSGGGPAGYTFCANENGTCSFSGTASVAYGANGAFNYQNATNSIGCNNATFGDPIQGTVKACYYQLTNTAYTFCANENGTCSFSGTQVVRYGANSSYFYRTATSSIACNNATFGDPIPGTVKHCDTSPQPPNNGWTQCASENGTCTIPGTVGVAYGANGTFFYRPATDSIACNNATFGDPIPGTAKACYYK